MSRLIVNALVFMLAVALSVWVFYDVIDHYTLIRHCSEATFCKYSLVR